MPTIPCKVTIECPGADEPISNFSSEAPDLINFGAIGYPIFNPDNPIGDNPRDPLTPAFVASGCQSVCYSTISQDDANTCAAAQAYNCDFSLRDPPPNNPVFFNEQQTCAFPCPDGSQFFATVPAGTVSAPDPVLANRIASQMACNQAAAKHVCLVGSFPTACLGSAYSSTLTISAANPGPYNAQIIGTLPPGLFPSQTPTSITIFGTPNTAGIFPIQIAVSDPQGNTITRPFTIKVIGITSPATLPPATANIDYSYQLIANGGVAPYFWSIVGNSTLPGGLSLSATGLIYGAPLFGTSGTKNYSFTVEAADLNGNACTLQMSISVNQPPGPDWSQLVWDQFSITTGPGNPVNATASKWKSNGSLTKDAGGFYPCIGYSGQLGSGAVHASLIYTGPAANCRVTLVVSNTSGSGDLHCSVKQNGVLLTGYSISPLSSGTTILNFALAPGVGSLIEISDTTNNAWAELFGIGSPGSMVYSWVIQNV